MPQTILFLDEIEDTKIKQIAKNWGLSKAEAVRKVIQLFKEPKLWGLNDAWH